MSVINVLVTDGVSDSGLAPLLEDDRFDVTQVDKSSTPEFPAALSDAEALVVRSATKVTGEMMDLEARGSGSWAGPVWASTTST